MSSLAIPCLSEQSGKRNLKKRPLLGKIFLFFLLFLVLVFILEVLYQIVILPRLVVNKISLQVEPGISLSDAQILDLAGLSGEESFFALNVDRIRQNLEAYPLVKEARVSKTFPDTLEIVLLKRSPLAMAFVDTGQRTVPVLFDSGGVIYEIGASLSNYDVPVVSGIRFPELKLGMRIPAELVVFLEDLEKLKDANPTLFGLISEIKFIKKMANDYEVILYPTIHPVKVRLGNRLDENLLKYIVMVLDVVAKGSLLPGLEEIDFRTGDVVYRVREE